jgi:hypothetical protein
MTPPGNPVYCSCARQVQTPFSTSPIGKKRHRLQANLARMNNIQATGGPNLMMTLQLFATLVLGLMCGSELGVAAGSNRFGDSGHRCPVFFRRPAPINNRIAKWTPETIPADWNEREHRWDLHHWFRTLVPNGWTDGGICDSGRQRWSSLTRMRKARCETSRAGRQSRETGLPPLPGGLRGRVHLIS